MDPSRQIISEEILNIENINTTLSSLLDCLSKVYDSIPQSSSNNNLNTEYHFTHKQLDKLRKHLNKIKEAFQTLNKFEDYAGGQIKKIKNSLDDICKVVTESPKDLPIKKVQAKLSALKKDATELKSSIPPWRSKMSSKNSDILVRTWSRNGFNSEVDELPSLYMSPKFLYSSVFAEFQEDFKDFNNWLKVWLLSFAILPANTVVKRRLLIDWLVGEGLDPRAAKEILKELVLKDFIEEVKESHKLVADRLKMQPQVRHVLIMFAQDAGFSVYNLNGIKTVNSSRCNKAFLVKADYGNLELTKERHDLNQEKLHTIFNINETFPDQRFELFAKVKNVNTGEWFSKMKNVNVLFLGRWQSSGQHHIEVESTEFLKGLKNMECLRLLSLQGISRINELPYSIGKLTNLRILDLKACHNLEVLPDEIVSLKKLLRLDISECYLLDDMPRGLGFLPELRVLKGFIIGYSKSRNSCTLEDLVGLKKLSKLSINTSNEAFPTDGQLHALRELKALRKLAITWGGKTMEKENAELTSAATMNSEGLPTELKKLELQCFPHSDIPNWLIPEKLKSLKKLHITGGKKLENLGPNEWTVEILRLKHLRKFNMDWYELQTSFPKLCLLENVECPVLSSRPRVWRKPECQQYNMNSPSCFSFKD